MIEVTPNDRYREEDLMELAVNELTARGMQENRAKIFAKSLIKADMCGVPTHGIRMLPAYLDKIDRNEFSFDEPELIKHTATFSIVDGKNNIGAISASMATYYAAMRASDSGMYTVFIRNTNTIGAAFYFAEKMTEHGKIGFVCGNSPAAMTPNNGLEAMIGTNPFAISFPTKSYGPFTVDMATSIVAKSRFGIAKAKGEPLEDGWALDKNGNPTTDPDEGIQGFIQPMAGQKGFAIAMIIDLLSGLLAGSACLNEVNKFYSKDGKGMNVGQVMIAIDPTYVYGNSFYEEMDKYIEKLRNIKTIEGTAITLPGDNKRKNENKAIQEGIYIDPNTIHQLNEIRRDYT